MGACVRACLKSGMLGGKRVKMFCFCCSPTRERRRASGHARVPPTCRPLLVPSIWLLFVIAQAAYSQLGEAEFRARYWRQRWRYRIHTFFRAGAKRTPSSSSRWAPSSNLATKSVMRSPALLL